MSSHRFSCGSRNSAGGYVCLGLGRRGIDLCRFAFHDEGTEGSTGQAVDPLIRDSRQAATAIEFGSPAAIRKSGLPAAVLKIDDRAVRRLAIAELLAKAGYNSGEPRDWHGRWTDDGSGGGGSNRNAAAVAVGAIAGAPAADAIGAAGASLFGNVGRAVLAGLAELGAAAPAAFLGTLFIPTNRAPVSQGTLPDHPNIAYRFDRDTGSLTLEQDGQELYSGHARLDGVFVDNEGRPFGRIVAAASCLTMTQCRTKRTA